MTAAGKITGVHTIGIPVSDQDRALGFYVGTLGFEKRLDADMGGGQRWIEVAPPGAAITVAQASGVHVDEVLRWPGVPPMFAFRDADGNGMEIVEQR
jgi:lactoylglutathione lyase